MCVTEDDEAAVVDSPGDRVTLEAKHRWDQSIRNQCVGHATIMSFTMTNRQPNLNPLIPAIGISTDWLVAALYDCKADVLLVLTDDVRWLSTAAPGEFDAIGLVVLWLLLHHRLFLRKIDAKGAKGVCCGLASVLHSLAFLEEFKKLSELNQLSFGSTKHVWESRAGPLARGLFSPRAKKPRTE